MTHRQKSWANASNLGRHSQQRTIQILKGLQTSRPSENVECDQEKSVTDQVRLKRPGDSTVSRHF